MWCCSQHEVIFLSFIPLMFGPCEAFKFTHFQPKKLPGMLMSWLTLFTLMCFNSEMLLKTSALLPDVHHFQRKCRHMKMAVHCKETVKKGALWTKRDSDSGSGLLKCWEIIFMHACTFVSKSSVNWVSSFLRLKPSIPSSRWSLSLSVSEYQVFS